MATFMAITDICYMYAQVVAVKVFQQTQPVQRCCGINLCYNYWAHLKL